MFRFLITGNSNDPDEAIEQISDILPLEEAQSFDDGLFVAETRNMDGIRNADIANMNLLEADGVVNSWNYCNKGTN